MVKGDSVNLRILNRETLLLSAIIIITIFSFPSASADVISINSGGTGNVILNPDRFIEGFFFGDVEEAGPVCGNGIVETGEQCDDGNTVSGDGCSATCQTEAVTPPGGGGGGGEPSLNIAVSPTEFNINLAVDTTTPRTIQVTNLGTSQVVATVSHNLGSHAIIENTSLTIPGGGSVELNVVFVALSEPGVFTGTINIGGQTVLVSLNVKTELLLFDSNIVVLNENYQVAQGEELRTLVTLIPLGDPSRLDVTLNFIIKDFRNQLFLTRSETLLVDSQVQLNRNFDTGALPLGDYVVGLELVYPNGVAPSSAHFKVVERILPGIFGRIVIFLLMLILLILIIIIIILIIRRLREKQRQKQQGLSTQT
jgi:cysteine-rich repeat protein